MKVPRKSSALTEDTVLLYCVRLDKTVLGGAINFKLRKYFE